MLGTAQFRSNCPILGVSHETVIQHLKHARERYGVQKRTLLAIRALFDGLISFSDILKH